MIQNYTKIAWRNLIRNRAYSLINILGLAVGLVSCLLIFLFIHDELNYDRYHEHSDQIYRMYRSYSQAEGGRREMLATSNLLAPTLEKEVPGIAAGMRLSNRWPEVLVEQGSTKFYEEKFFFADPSVFSFFSFQLLKGNSETALSRPFTVILTEEVARKYFDTRDPIGQTLTISGLWGPDEYEVTGVMEGTPHNSHFSINFLTSFETLRAKTPRASEQFENWMHIGSYTYVLLHPGVAPEDLAGHLRDFYSRHHSEREGITMEYRLQPVTDIHLYSHFEREIEPNSNPGYLIIFGSIALLILGIAGVNYINLATARSADRAMEVGIRKTLGVSRARVMVQFLSESLIFCLISLVLALFLAEALLPFFNDLTGKSLSLHFFSSTFLSALAGIFITIGLMAGIYPAFVLSRFNPGQVFRGAVSGRQKSLLRNTLVVFQFVISIILIIGTMVISGQLDHIRTRHLGINDEQVVSLSTGPGIDFKDNYEAFKNRLLSYTDIESITHGGALPYTTEIGLELAPEGMNSRIPVDNFSVGKDYLKTLEIPLKKGRDISDLSTRIEGDESADNEYITVLINEAAAAAWGWDEPLGKTFEGFAPTFRVMGVVEDFHYRSLKEEIAPLVMWPSSYSVNNVLIRMNTENIRQTMATIEDAWNEMGPGTPMEYTFLDDRFDSLYQTDDRLASLFGVFTFLAVLIACLGLFGLAAYTAETRTKEIGIRKVLGASVAGIVALLSKDFLKLVFIGFVIATPIAWYAMNRWLEDFAYRIEIGPGVFLLAGLAALAIALVTVSWQSVKAGLMNPVNSLRSE